MYSVRTASTCKPSVCLKCGSAGKIEVFTFCNVDDGGCCGGHDNGTLHELVRRQWPTWPVSLEDVPAKTEHAVILST